MRPDIIERDKGVLSVKEVDKSIRNVWRWEWLEKRVDEQHVGEFIRKVAVAGKAYCTACLAEINYGGRGLLALQDHLKSKKHRDVMKIRASNYRIPGAQPEPSCQTYGIHPMFRGCMLPKTQCQAKASTFTPLPDRIKNAEATVLAFTAENSLSFSMVPRLCKLVQALSKDKKATDSLKMDRTTAAYKMQYGLAKTLKNQLVEDLQSSYFSLNIDESTSNNNKKVLAILVSYFSSSKKEVIVNHLESINVTKVNSESLYNVLVELFIKLDISWSKCMSILMDSCAVMRGSKSGLEIRIRKNLAEHLLDIDGDSCHHVHNACKSFCKPFNFHLEGLLCDVFSDFKWSADQKEYLTEICLMLGIKYTVPQRYVSHRWLSVYDVSVDTVRLFSAYTVFYYSFLKREDKVTYMAIVVEVYKRLTVGHKSRQAIREIQKKLQEKNMTAEGKERKNRILQKMFFKRRLSRLILHLYVSVLPLLKKYVMVFEMKEPMVHKLNDYQEELLRNFLSCFVCPEVLCGLHTGKQLKSLKLDLGDCLLPVKQMFVGVTAKRIMEKMRTADSKEFLLQTRSAYVTCAQHLQRKMPLDNALLKAISAIDPVSLHHTVTLTGLLQLPTLVTNVLQEEEVETYGLEVRKLTSDPNLPPYVPNTRIDTWWGNLQEDRYPVVAKMINAILSCFHGPQVESSFNVMGDVMAVKSPAMQVETYSAIQTIKYSVRSSGKDAVTLMQKADYLHDPVDHKLCRNLDKASRVYKEQKLVKRLELEKKKKIYGLEMKLKLQTKKKAKELSDLAAGKSRIAHQKKLLKRKALMSREEGNSKKPHRILTPYSGN